MLGGACKSSLRAFSDRGIKGIAYLSRLGTETSKSCISNVGGGFYGRAGFFLENYLKGNVRSPSC